MDFQKVIQRLKVVHKLRTHCCSYLVTPLPLVDISMFIQNFADFIYVVNVWTISNIHILKTNDVILHIPTK